MSNWEPSTHTEKDAEIKRLRDKAAWWERTCEYWHEQTRARDRIVGLSRIERDEALRKLAAVAALADEWQALTEVPMPERADTETSEDQGFRLGAWSVVAKASAELSAVLANSEAS